MKKEDLFRAIGEVREEQIKEAETVRRQTVPWKRILAGAACAAFIVTAASAIPWLDEEMRWKAIIWSFNPGDTKESAGGAGTGGLDGTDYEPVRVSPDISVNVEFKELEGPDTPLTGQPYMSGTPHYYPSGPEPVLDEDTVIFRGTVQKLRYYQVTFEVSLTGEEGTALPCTVASIKVTDSLRGGLQTAGTRQVLFIGLRKDIEEGMDGIFMPYTATAESGYGIEDGTKESVFCFADLAQLYFPMGRSTDYTMFLDTGNGLSFDRDVYAAIAEAKTLDDVAAYIREMIGEEEQTQPASEPLTPQTEPSETVNAGDTSNGPAGAREQPGGAFIGAFTGEDKPGASP